MFEEEHAGRFRKPDLRYFEGVTINTARVLQREGRIPSGGVFVEDIVFIGDRPDLDVAASRMMRHVVVASDVVPPLGPLTVTVPDFPTLLSMARYPERIKNQTLRRLAMTLRLPQNQP